MRVARRDVVAAAIALALVAASFIVPRLHWGIRTRLDLGPDRFSWHADAAPLFGSFDAHLGWGTGPAILLALSATWWGPIVAQRLSWRPLLLIVWATSCAWAFSLAMIDGWQRGFAGRLADKDEYLPEVPGITDIPATLRTFSSRILDFQPNSWIIHVSGHPPGALLTFVWLNRIGLGGGAWAGLLCLLVGSSAAAAIIVTLRVMAGERAARSAAPFVAVAPTAIWIAVSADGYFAGVASWGIALLALSACGTVRFPALAAAAAGLLLGWAVFLSYGLTLMAFAASAVLVCATDRRSALRALGSALGTAGAVAAVFAVSGFNWFDGYTLVQQRYWQGIAHDRPFQYWSWANLASVVCAIGLGGAAGLSGVFDLAAIRRRSGLHLLMLGMLAAIICADLSMLSKAETERIWLPFTVWLTAAPALLPGRTHRLWLACNVFGALLVNSLILTRW